MGKIEQWIRRSLSSAVAAGSGEWATSTTLDFGKSIYKVTDGSMTLTLSELGFSYKGATPTIEYRYDEVKSLALTPVENIMKLRGDLNAPIMIGVMVHGASLPVDMRWPLRVYSNVATVLDRIVRELA